MRARIALPFALLLLTGAATRDDPLAGRVAGAATDCLPRGVSRGPSIADDGAILFHESRRRVWRTTAIGACATLRPLDTLIIEAFDGQTCRNDRFRALSPGQSIAALACRFDRFVPYDAR